ncbi:F-box domain protein [Penicillium brasilianum]|uniref:F-box domain protein n=1 Tax=Penicillium brasilianum TaxID=104259 RepID=A0A1S9RGN5_PENBI|nr:F-box domain protein [Penicillium brasilianum]
MAASCPLATLDGLPFDVFYQIATLLDDRDCIHLSRTNRAIHDLMNCDLIARKTVESVLAHSKEGRTALAAQSGYRKAVGHRFDIHEAIATASPYAVAMLAYAVDFVYHQGILCYRVGHEIRLLNVHRGARQEQVLNLYEVIPRLDAGSPEETLDPAARVKLLHYSNGIVVFRLEGIGAQADSLVAIDMATRQTRRKRLLVQRPIPASAPIFVRHSRSYLWYIFFVDSLGSHGTWLCHGVDLATDETIQFHLEQALGGEPGQTMCFDIYQDHLYFISTTVTSEDDERFSSFYHWTCYAPRSKSRKWSDRLWRREHREGPINEMWTDLSIRKDETTGRPMIVECRREWPDGKSENHRTTYIEPLSTPAELQATHPQGNIQSPSSSDDDSDDENSGPSKDPVIDREYDHRPEKRLRRNYHHEHELGDDPNERQEFIHAYTKHHSYDLASSTFVDLVNDPTPKTAGVRVRDRIRLRTVSRKRKCPIDEEGIAGIPGLLFPPTQVDTDGRPVENSEEYFVSRGVHMWPADDGPAELHNLLCPDQRSGVVAAVADERSLIYSISCPGLPSGHQAIILLSFDPALRLPMLMPLRSMKSLPSVEGTFPVTLPKPRASGGGLIRESDPLYAAINRGYWLR